jgi:hypothetical protein
VPLAQLLRDLYINDVYQFIIPPTSALIDTLGPDSQQPTAINTPTPKPGGYSLATQRPVT